MRNIITENFEYSFMYFVKKLSGFLLVLGLIASCSKLPNHDWPAAVPAKTPFIIVPAEQTYLNTIFDSPFIPFLDDITASATSLVSQVDSGATAPITVEAILLYPGTNSRLQSVWATKAPNNILDNLKSRYYQNFAQNQYQFQEVTIHSFEIRDRILYAAQLNDLLLLSESSLGIEDAVRSYLGLQDPADLAEADLKPGTLIMNTPSLDKWAEQLAQVIYRPSIINAFAGTRPAVLQVTPNGDEENETLNFAGTIPLEDNPRSELVASVSEENLPVQLDRYISSNAAAFGIFRLSPRMAPPPSVENATRLDSALIKDKVLYAKLAKTLQKEFALVTYAESGFLSTGEHLFIRTLDDRSTLQTELNTLVRKGLIERVNRSYFVSSEVLARMIGSELTTFRDFYLSLTGNTVVISKRRGLAEIVASDRSRRRVIYYEPDYMDIRKNFPEDVSGLFVLNTEFDKFIRPLLATNNYTNALTSNFDYLTITTRLDESESNLDFSLTTYTSDETNVPYQEQWLFPTGGAELSGQPVLADIGGSSRDEVIFATNSGSIYALATDGTVVLQVDTDNDKPIGSPVVYDWYSTGQKVILQAAGNKVYGWDDSGSPLPRFPFELDELITSPLTVSDVDRNGLPEAIVATADRNLHALDGRGNNLKGWPLTTNAQVTSTPLVDYFQGNLSVIAFSANAVHAWTPGGSPKADFPKFVNATLNGSPVIHNNTILGGAADGNLYSVGNNITFSDSLNVYSNTSDSSDIGAVYVSNSALLGTPSIHNLSIRSDEHNHNGPAILTMSSNGSVFLLDEQGRLLLTQNMGQPSAPEFSPLYTDLDNDGGNDIVALANFGRLYAWNTGTSERLYSIPTSGVSNVIISDIDNNGYKELIAQTREGVRCWTIYGTTE